MTKQRIREDFCPACLAVPLIFAGGGAAAACSLSPEEEEEAKKNRRALIIWGGIITTILSIAVYIYFRFVKKCKSCQLPP